MARIHWIKTYDRLGDNELQEEFLAPDQGLIMKGIKIIFCKNCKRWVPAHDYYNYCKSGMCEYSSPYNIKL